MSDEFEQYRVGLASPAVDALAVTPDADPLPFVTRGLWVGGDGNLTVTMASGNDVVIENVLAGSLLPLRVSHVLAATTASAIVALQ